MLVELRMDRKGMRLGEGHLFPGMYPDVGLEVLILLLQRVLRTSTYDTSTPCQYNFRSFVV